VGRGLKLLYIFVVQTEPGCCEARQRRGAGKRGVIKLGVGERGLGRRGLGRRGLGRRGLGRRDVSRRGVRLCCKLEPNISAQHLLQLFLCKFFLPQLHKPVKAELGPLRLLGIGIQRLRSDILLVLSVCSPQCFNPDLFLTGLVLRLCVQRIDSFIP